MSEDDECGEGEEKSIGEELVEYLNLIDEVVKQIPEEEIETRVKDLMDRYWPDGSDE